MPKAPVRLQTHQGYQVFNRLPYFTVYDHVVELRLRRKLGPRGLQPLLPLRGRLSTTPDEPAYQFLPRRRRQEDEPSIGAIRLDLPRSLQIDL